MYTPLVLVVQDDHQVWQEDAKSAQERSEDGAVHTLPAELAQPDSEVEEHAASTDNCTTSAIALSPLTLPLEASLEDLRRERRATMSHATRLRVEAMMGDRELDLEGVRSVISQTEVTRRGDAGIDGGGAGTSSRLKVSLQTLEAECTASTVNEWVTAAEFSFSTALRTPDDRWAAVCLRLENEIAGWLARREEASGDRHTRGRRGDSISEGVGGRANPRSVAPPGVGDRVWEALEMFEIEAGDIVDDRHASAEMTATNINDEADLVLRDWTEKVEVAAIEMCAAERASYYETVATLRALDGLFGLQEDRSGSLEAAREAACAAAGALVEEASSVLGGRNHANEGRVLVTEVRRAADACQRKIATPSARGARAGCPPLPQEEGGAITPSKTRGVTEDQPPYGQQPPTLMLGEDTPHGGTETEECGGALTAAIWRCRLAYARRLGGVVTRLAEAAERCEAKVASTKGAVKRLKRRRVQLEHEGVSTAASTVRRALEDFDRVAIRNILHNGVPVRQCYIET